MKTGPGRIGRHPRRSGRGALLLGVIALTFSLLAPFAVSSDLAIARGEKECPRGQVFDPEAGCVDDPDGTGKECPDGQVLDPRQGCVDAPDPDKPKEQDSPACPEGQAFDEKQQQCLGEVPARGKEPVTIQLALRLCPGDTKAAALGLDGLARACPENPNPVTVLHNGDGVPDEKRQVVGSAQWTGPAGGHSLTVAVPEGFGQPRAFCGLVDPNTGRPALRETRVENGRTLWLKLDAGQTAQCLWFDLAAETGGPGTGSNQIDVFAHACPPGMPAMKTVDDYRKACAPDDGWEFTLTTPDGPLDPVVTDEKGHAGWGQLPSGEWRLQEVLPGRFNDPIVFCRWMNWPDGVRLDRAWGQIPAPGGALPGRFDGDLYRIECYWFNHEPAAQVEGPNTYALVKYTCPEGVEPGQSLEVYQTHCTEPASDMVFEIEYDGNVISLTTDGSGRLEVFGIPTGAWRVTEFVPEGYGDPMTWCRYTDWPDDVNLRDDWFQKAASGGSMTGEFDIAGTRLECVWYNIRVPERSVYTFQVFKMWCPYDTRTDDVNTLIETCTYRDIPVEFTLSGGGIGMPATTIGATPAEWTLVGGSLTSIDLSESLPDGWEPLPVIWCQAWTDDTSTEPMQYPVKEGEVVIDNIETGMTVSCVWFNVSTDPESAGVPPGEATEVSD